MHSLPEPTGAIRGPALTFSGDPFQSPVDDCLVHETDAIVAFGSGVITHFGPASAIRKELPANLPIQHYGPDSLISAGFIDSHVHYPQTPMIGAFGEQLLDWLNKYTYPTERKFADRAFAEAAAEVFLRESLRNGITTSCVFCTVFPQSVDALFEAAQRLGMRIAAGKVMMNRNAPDYLLDTTQSSYDDSKALIEKWHGRDRLMYAITPRFAPTSTAGQLDAAGRLWDEFPDVYLQTHLSENRGEVEWVRELFPDRDGYLDVYHHSRLCRPRALFGHGLHLTGPELHTLHATGAAIAHCPTSNFFLGSGYFDLLRAVDPARPVRVGLGTDLGAGTSFSILQTLNEAYKAAKLNHRKLTASQAFYLATRGTARAMYLEDIVGSIAPGMEADLVVLDLKSTPLIEYRMQFAEDIDEALFIQMTLGDDRAVQATWVGGELRHEYQPG